MGIELSSVPCLAFQYCVFQLGYPAPRLLLLFFFGGGGGELKLNIFVYTCLKLGYLLSGRVNREEGGGTLPTSTDITRIILHSGGPRERHKPFQCVIISNITNTSIRVGVRAFLGFMALDLYKI